MLILLGVALGLWSPTAGAAGSQAAAPDPGTVAVAKISGLIDPVLADFMESTIGDAERTGAKALVFQVNSGGAVVSDARVRELADRISTAKVRVEFWVGPSGADAHGETAQLAGVSDRIGIAPGSNLGDIGELVVDPQQLTPAFRTAVDRLQAGTVGARDAKRLGIAPQDSPIIGEHILDIPGVQAQVVTQGNRTVRQPLTRPVFSAPPVTTQILHTVSSPAVAYLLFIIGCALILFELFTAGVGVAGVVGAGFFILGCYGLAVLPSRSWAVALLVLAMIAYGIDIQTGVPRFWTGAATVSLIVGSLFLYDGLSLSWITLLAGIGGITLAMLAGMPAMVRTRFSTPTIGREWMVGEEGEAMAAISPDGVVRIRGALWRARTNRATPIDSGARIRVVGIEGLLLEVEPEEGGAEDYRDRARQRKAKRTWAPESESDRPEPTD